MLKSDLISMYFCRSLFRSASAAMVPSINFKRLGVTTYFYYKCFIQCKCVCFPQERLENVQFLDKLEKQMRDSLSSDVRLMHELQATKKLAELKKQYDETVER